MIPDFGWKWKEFEGKILELGMTELPGVWDKIGWKIPKKFRIGLWKFQALGVSGEEILGFGSCRRQKIPG